MRWRFRVVDGDVNTGGVDWSGKFGAMDGVHRCWEVREEARWQCWVPRDGIGHWEPINRVSDAHRRSGWDEDVVATVVIRCGAQIER